LFSPRVCWCRVWGLPLTGGRRGQRLHGRARTTAVRRRARPPRPDRRAKRPAPAGLHPATSATWQKRASGQAAPLGPTPPPAPGLSRADEARRATVRRQALRPLDEGREAWPAPLPHLTRAALPGPRCLTTRAPCSPRPAARGPPSVGDRGRHTRRCTGRCGPRHRPSADHNPSPWTDGRVERVPRTLTATPGTTCHAPTPPPLQQPPHACLPRADPR
jgi:hypothetical protein